MKFLLFRNVCKLVLQSVIMYRWSFYEVLYWMVHECSFIPFSL